MTKNVTIVGMLTEVIKQNARYVGINNKASSARERRGDEMRIYYFGCDEVPGHYLKDHERKPVSHYENDLPWSDIDGNLCPQDTAKEGIVKLTYKDGWTAAAFWDYSIDKRTKSNSVIFIEDLLDLSEVKTEFKEHFPHIYNRFEYDLIEWIEPEERT